MRENIYNARKVGRAPLGRSRDPVFLVFQTMISRCMSERNSDYKNYGGRGITVCSRWLEPDGRGFLNFYADMGERPIGLTKCGTTHPYTLERIDNDGNYEPTNCRWASYEDQRSNQRVTK